ncbi:MAG: type I restriction endonuclease, partial [Chloroflexota bacterium]
MNNTIHESEIEQIALELLRDENGYIVLTGPDLLEGASSERVFTEVTRPARLRAAIDRLNPHIPVEAREDAFKKALRALALTVIDNNEAFHRLLTEGVD